MKLPVQTHRLRTLTMTRVRQAVPLPAVFLVLFPAGLFQVLLQDARAAAPATLPALIVEAAYPGAGPQVVEDTVAAPIEMQLNGLEKLQHLRSR
jgi:multidrug efflux pump subunit AcrB